MDPVALLLIASTFAASQVAQKCADAAIDAAWQKIRLAVRSLLGREPSPNDLEATSSVVRRAAADSDLLGEAEAVFGAASSLRRATLASRALTGAKVLWVDDQPSWTAWERTLFHALGVQVTPVLSTASALTFLEAEPFDLIVSDISREGSPTGGLVALPELVPYAPVIFYVANLDHDLGPPRDAFGITNRPDELLHLVLDLFERTRL